MQRHVQIGFELVKGNPFFRLPPISFSCIMNATMAAPIRVDSKLRRFYGGTDFRRGGLL